MNEKLKENSTFLRYYEILRVNPSSVVFAPLAEILIIHNCYQDAVAVCQKGLEYNPDALSGRIALARAYLGLHNYKMARAEAEKVLAKIADHPEALSLREIASRYHVDRKAERADKKTELIEKKDIYSAGSLNPEVDKRWSTVTMAEIFAAQGNYSKARNIYNTILKNDPGNLRAKEGLNGLLSREELEV